MSCLLPHFNCHPHDSFRTPPPPPPPTLPHHHLILQTNTRRNLYFRPQCVLSAASPSTSESKALLDFDKDLTFNAVVQANFKATSSAESLLTSEEAVIAAAASEALALAKAAAKVAKDAALLVKKKPQAEAGQRSQVSSTPESLLLKWVQHMEVQDVATGGHMGTGAEIMNDVYLSPCKEEFDDEEPTHEELERVEEQLSDSIDARSGRQTERKAKRVRAAGKATANIVSFKSGSASRKKRVRPQEVDYSDPLRYLRTTTRSTKLLTPAEEIKLSEGIQILPPGWLGTYSVENHRERIEC